MTLSDDLSGLEDRGVSGRRENHDSGGDGEDLSHGLLLIALFRTLDLEMPLSRAMDAQRFDFLFC
jgi:hypothetical protein